VEISCEHGNYFSVSLICWEVLEWLYNWQQASQEGPGSRELLSIDVDVMRIFVPMTPYRPVFGHLCFLTAFVSLTSHVLICCSMLVSFCIFEFCFWYCFLFFLLIYNFIASTDVMLYLIVLFGIGRHMYIIVTFTRRSKV
jgi:hypothetical protein